MALMALVVAVLLFGALLVTQLEVPVASQLVCEMTAGEWKGGRILSGCLDTR